MKTSDHLALGRTPDDENPELSADLVQFARRLSGYNPATADMDPAITFFRAGYAAGVADRGAAPNGRVTVLRRAASWLLILALGGSVGYLGGGKRWESGDANRETVGGRWELSDESGEVGGGEREAQDDRRETEAGGWDVAEADVSEADVAEADAAGTGKELEPHGPGDRALGKGEVELAWSRIVGWLEVPERRPVFVGMGHGQFASPRARRTLMDNLLAQIHDPLAQPPVTPRLEPDVASSPAETTGSPSSDSDPGRALSPLDSRGPLQPTSLRDVIDQRALLLESLLQ